MNNTKEAGTQTEALRVEDNLENWDFWTGIEQESLMKSFRSRADVLDKMDSDRLSRDDFEILEGKSEDVRYRVLEFLASLTVIFRWRPLIHPPPIVYGREPSKYRTPQLPFFLGSSSIVLMENCYKFVLVMHSHAAAAFVDDKYTKAAENFLELSLRSEDSYRSSQPIHGVLMIGGKVTLYEQHGKKLCPVTDKPGEQWSSIADKEVLSRLLGIVMRAWRAVEPHGIEDAIEETIKGTRTTFEDAFPFEKDRANDGVGGIYAKLAF